jgi:hypothetical protein
MNADYGLAKRRTTDKELHSLLAVKPGSIFLPFAESAKSADKK